MKKTLFIVFLLFLTIGSSQEFLLADEDSNKYMLANFIKKSISENKLDKNLVIVVNEKVIKGTELTKFKFYSSDIISLSLIEKNNAQMVDVYGEQSLNGIILLETKPFQERAVASIPKSKVLYLLNDKAIKEEDLKKINPDDIANVNVIKDKTEIVKYTSEQVDGVVIIMLKNK